MILTALMLAQAATGWELSRTSRSDDLAESLRTGPAGGKLESLRRMLDGDLSPPGC